MLRLRALVATFFPELRLFGLPAEFYVGSKWLALFAEPSLPSGHVFLLWDLVIFYGSVQPVYGEAMLLSMAGVLFQEAAAKDSLPNSAHELKWLVDNPLILELRLMRLPGFSDALLSLFLRLFPSGLISSFFSDAVNF